MSYGRCQLILLLHIHYVLSMLCSFPYWIFLFTPKHDGVDVLWPNLGYAYAGNLVAEKCNSRQQCQAYEHVTYKWPLTTAVTAPS